MTAPDIVKLRARIRALLAKTVDAGCTEAEAETAAARARELMREHGLTEEGLLGFEIVELHMPLTKRPAITDPLGAAIALACQCQTWFRVGDDRARVYYGFEPDTLVAEYLHEVAYAAVERARAEFRASPEYKRRRTAKTRKGAVDAFVQGFTNALICKIAPTGAPAARELEKKRKVDAALEARAISFKKGKEPPRARADAFSGAYASGLKVGAAASIHTGMNGNEPTRQIGFRGGAE